MARQNQNISDDYTGDGPRHSLARSSTAGHYPSLTSTAEQLAVRVDTAAILLDVSPSTIRRLIRSGALAVIPLPKGLSTVMITMESVTILVNSAKKSSSGEPA